MQACLTLSALNAASEQEFVAALSGVFEHAPWVAQAVCSERPFADVQALHEAMIGAIRALPEDRLLRFLCAHPELAGAQARAGSMTLDSTREQGGLALAQLPAAENARWDQLNSAYRERFGFPFILCARRHSYASMLRSFERRLLNDRSTELDAALGEIVRISRLRLAARVADHALPRIAGRLTTHVLDISRGRPAAGMRVELMEASGTAARALVDTLTDASGSTSVALLDGEPLRIGRYEMRFHVGDYFRRLGTAANEEEPFLDVVPIAFGVNEPEGDYHVPITITPWAYSTYRGD